MCHRSPINKGDGGLLVLIALLYWVLAVGFSYLVLLQVEAAEKQVAQLRRDVTRADDTAAAAQQTAAEVAAQLAAATARSSAAAAAQAVAERSAVDAEHTAEEAVAAAAAAAASAAAERAECASAAAALAEATIQAQQQSARAAAAEGELAEHSSAAQQAAAELASHSSAGQQAVAGALQAVCSSAATALFAAAQSTGSAAAVPPLLEEGAALEDTVTAVQSHTAALAAALAAALTKAATGRSQSPTNSIAAPYPVVTTATPSSSHHMDASGTTGGKSDMADVALDMEPLLRQSGAGGASSGMRSGVVTQRRDGGADGGWFGGANDRDREDSPGGLSPTAGGVYDIPLTWRPMRAMPVVRKLPLRAQAVISRVDDWSLTALGYLGDVPVLRAGFLIWVVVLHTWLILLQSLGCLLLCM